MFNTVLTDECVSDKCKESLLALGYVVVRLPSFRGLSSPIASHPDILLAKLKDGSLVLCKEYYESEKSFFDELPVKIKITEEKLSSGYPNDILFDALAVNNRVYGKEGCVSRFILEDNDEFVAVKQGYARCSVAMLSDSCAVTSDRGLAEALMKDGIKVLLISPGNIRLKGYDTGFIGGAGGRLLNGVYSFFGDIMSHPDGEKIIEFASQNKINAVSLSDEPLCDNGGLILL